MGWQNKTEAGELNIPQHIYRAACYILQNVFEKTVPSINVQILPWQMGKEW